MAKFNKSISTDDETTAPTVNLATVAVAPSVTVIDVNNNQAAVQQAAIQVTAQAQAQSSVGLAEISIDKDIIYKQLEKEDEHWMKSYWRPAMGWLYMVICFMDFVAFPAISMFLPTVTKLPYVAWQSLTLSNGGLIHMAFGAILGVAAYGRTQEKVASKQ